MDGRNRLIQMIQEASGCLRYYAELIADKLLAEGVIVLPCKIGDTIYSIKKSCDINNYYKDEYKCYPEFEHKCEFFEEMYWERPQYCEKIGEADSEYCDFNLDIYCENCKDRLCIQKDTFDYAKIPQIYGTPRFDTRTKLCDTYFLTYEEAKQALRTLKGATNEQRATD